jgi:ACS family hexuronate transporter-like MFS transporter
MRWVIISLLFVATTINYLDRAVLGVLLPEIRKQLSISTEAYGNITAFFFVAYAIGSLAGGRLLDRLGTRIGYGVAAAVWSAAAMLNAVAGSALQFGIFRFLLGLGEAPNFPACNKAAAEWFPPAQRASVMGVVNSGTNVANIIGPPVLIWLAYTINWQACFVIMGAIGFLWLPVWLIVLRKGSQQAGPTEVTPKVSMWTIVKYKQAWGYALAKFLTDPVWFFYLFWLPSYLTTVRHFTPGERAGALSIVYAISGLGAVLGGVASSFLIRQGWSVGRARKATMLACAVIMPACGLGVVVESNQLAVFLFGMATAAHQAWMTNLFTTPGDVFPKHAVGSANGFGVFFGAVGGAPFAGSLPGYLIPQFGYVPVLLTMSCFYLIAWAIVHTMMGNLEPVKLEAVESVPLAGQARPRLSQA